MSATRVGIFATEQHLMDAVRECRRIGLPILSAHSAYPVHGLDEALGIRPTRLPIVCFVGGLVGAAIALWFQYWASATDWPINVGGKPYNSLPAFVPVAFEVMILLAGLSTVGVLLLRSGLLPGRSPRLRIPRVTDDRFALVVQAVDARFSERTIEDLWSKTRAVEVLDSEELRS